MVQKLSKIANVTHFCGPVMPNRAQKWRSVFGLVPGAGESVPAGTRKPDPGVPGPLIAIPKAKGNGIEIEIEDG